MVQFKLQLFELLQLQHFELLQLQYELWQLRQLRLVRRSFAFFSIRA